MQQQNQIKVGGSSYQITLTLGSGTQGSVYKGKSLQTGEEVAIKIQNNISQNEFDILQKLQRDPKAQIIGIKTIQREFSGQVTIVMELADQELYQYIVNNPEYRQFNKQQKNHIFKQMVIAVQELHELGYFHRDLKPENFVVFKKDQNGFVKTKLIDLGLAKQQQSLTQTKNVGTPYYMAPEIMNGTMFYDNSVDLWALGCIWFEMLTDQTFFQGNSQGEIFHQIMNMSQQEINMRIYQQQQLDANEKELISKLILKTQISNNNNQQAKQQRLTTKELLYYLSNPEAINNLKPQQQPQFQQQQQFQPQPQIQQQPIFQQYQYNQPQQQFQFKPQPQFQQKPLNQIQNFQNTVQDERIQNEKQIQILKEQLEKEIREKVEKEKAIEIEKINRDKEKQQQEKLLEFQREQELFFQKQIKEKEDEQKRKNEEMQMQIQLQQNQMKIDQLKIEQEIKQRNQIELEKKKLEIEKERKIREQEQKLKQESEEQTKLNYFKQKEQEMQERIAQEISQQYLLKFNQEQQEKRKKEEQEKQQQFDILKNNCLKSIKNVKDLTEQFIQKLEGKLSESNQNEFQNNNLQSEYEKEISNYIQKFRERLEIIRQDDHTVKQINQYHNFNVVDEIQTKYTQMLSDIVLEQSTVQNEIANKKEQISKIKKKEEEIREQQNQLKQQLQENKTQYENQCSQIEQKIRELNKNQNIAKEQIQLLSEERYLQSFKNIQSQFDSIAQYIGQIKQITKNQSQYQDISVQVYQISQYTVQLIKYNEELSQLIKQNEELIKELENFNKVEKHKAQIQLEQFEDEAQKYNQALNRHKSQKQQNQQLMQNMQQVKNQYDKELQNFKTIINENSILQRQELLRLINLLNQYLKDLENYDISLINYFEEQNKIKKQQELLSQLFDEAMQVKNSSQQSFQILYQQLRDYQNISQETQNQIEVFGRNQEELILEYLKEVQRHKQKNFEITLYNLEQQTQEIKSLMKKFKEKFDEKNRIAQNLILKFQEIKKVQDQKLAYFVQFQLEIGLIKEVIKNLNFNQGFEIYDFIIQHKQVLDEKLDQMKQYFEKCYKYFNEGEVIYHELKKQNQTKKEFEIQRNEISRYLDLLYDRSKKKLSTLQKLQRFISKQCNEIKFEGSQAEYLEVNECFKKTQKLQSLLEELSQQILDSYQKSQTDSSCTQDFISKVEQSLGQLRKQKSELQAIKQDQIKKFNECLKQNFESLVLQICIITTFSVYVSNEYYSRKIRQQQQQSEEKKKNLKQFETDQEEQTIIKAQLQKYYCKIEGRQFWQCNLQELIQEQNQSEEKQKKLLKDIIIKNQVRLRGSIKDQKIIKEIIEFAEYNELQQFKEFLMLADQKK